MSCDIILNDSTSQFSHSMQVIDDYCSLLNESVHQTTLQTASSVEPLRLLLENEGSGSSSSSGSSPIPSPSSSFAESTLVAGIPKLPNDEADSSFGTINTLSSGSSQWIYDLISQLSNWLEQIQLAEVSLPLPSFSDFIPFSSPYRRIPSPDAIQSTPTVPLWEDWEWVLSRAEEFSAKVTLEEATRIRGELSALRSGASTLQFRAFFRSLARETLSELKEDERSDLASVLDSSKSSKIISDVINRYKDQWLGCIQRTFFESSVELSEMVDTQWESFREEYYEQKYSKNIVGSLKELAFSASLGPKDVGINDKVLSDILWSIWKTLTESVRTFLEKDSISHFESTLLGYEVSQCKETLVRLWIQTVRNSRLGTAQSGRLTARWQEEIRQEKLRLAARVREHGVDARWSGGKVSIQRCEQDIKRLKSLLEQKLVFTLPSH